MKRIGELIIVMLCLVFCGFAVQSETDQRNNRTECIISLYEQKDIQYTETELLYACISSTNIQEISDLLSINLLKKNNGLEYTVVLTENGFYYIVGDSIHLDFRRVKFSEDETLKAISLISVGENIHDVMEADPSAQYDFLYVSASEFPLYSYHFYRNGESYYFIYDESGAVKYIDYFFI